MNHLNSLLTNHVACYFRELPVPRSVGGFLDLKFSEWIRLAVFAGAVGFVGYATYEGVRSIVPEDVARKAKISRRGKQFWCNKKIDKEKDKVSHSIDVEDIAEKVSLCRCWLSSSFPYCDGSHKAHNKETGDNVGPVTVMRKPLG